MKTKPAQPALGDLCTACGKRPTCAIAGAAILVVAKDHRGVVTQLCRACGAGEDDADQVAKTPTKESR